jgi:hypothetical protein
LTGLLVSGTLTIAVPFADLADFEIPPGSTADSYSVVVGGGNFSGTSVPGVFFGGSATAGGTSTITYTFTDAVSEAPEPATTAMMSGALLGLGLLGKRLRKR